MINRLELGGCGCCAETRIVEVVERATMPDGKTILRLQDVLENQTWWYDEDLGAHYEASATPRWSDCQ